MPTGVSTVAVSFAVFSGLFIISNLFEYLTVKIIVFPYDLVSLLGLNYSNCIDIMLVAHSPLAIFLLHMGIYIGSRMNCSV